MLPDDYTPPLKHMLLAYAADWFVVPEVLEAAKADVPGIENYYALNGIEDPAQSSLRAMVTEVLPETFAIPLLSKKYCDLLLDEVKNLPFIPNPDEDVARQMPEVVLHERLPYVYSALRDVVYLVLNPIFHSLWQQRVEGVHIQVANYNPKDKAQGAWHHDDSSDITVVVPLNTGEYVGGGTDFYSRGTVAPLPTGTALIFPSATHLHRGRLVESGDRYLLVFWLRMKRGAHAN